MRDAHTKQDQQRRGNDSKITKDLEKRGVKSLACCGLATQKKVLTS